MIVCLSKMAFHVHTRTRLTIHRMLKDKKKLAARVESLTRKVQSLQNKLATAKEATSAPSTKGDISPPTQPGSSSSITPMSQADIIPPVPKIPVNGSNVSLSIQTTNRVVSGPASLARPKTPERRPAQFAVFKARTPEKRSTPVISPATVADTMVASSSSSSVGKKRARPEEFDAVNIPVQALYADERQDRENTTPRLRRALHSVQVHTGFTPVRHANARTTHGVPSPGRRATMAEAGISDVTNSPRLVGCQSAKAEKRSWLGKIRGGSSQASNRTPTSSRPGIFDRVPES